MKRYQVLLQEKDAERILALCEHEQSSFSSVVRRLLVSKLRSIDAKRLFKSAKDLFLEDEDNSGQ